MERTEKKAKVLEVELPERLAEALEALVSAGWFKDEAELARTALSEVLIPPAVARELHALATDWAREIADWPQVAELTDESSTASATWLHARVLDPGEAEAVALAHASSTPIGFSPTMGLRGSSPEA